MDYKSVFTEIYDKNVWGGSGGGSMPEATKSFRKFLQTFLKEKDIRSVIDFGCGDWSSTHLINWTGIEYLGIDIVESVINANVQKFQTTNIQFRAISNNEEMRHYSADLLIIKDVLMHWNDADITSFIKSVRDNFTYMMLINVSSQTEDYRPNHAPQSRPLSADFLPLKAFNPEVLLTYCDNANEIEKREIALIWNRK